MYQGRRGTLAMFLWWVRFPPAPRKQKIKRRYEEKDSYRGHNEIQQGNDEKRSRNQHLNTGGDKKNCEKD
jgi:hypothetical protein